MNAEDRLIICSKFAEIRKILLWQTGILVAIAVAIGVEIPISA